MSPLLAEARSPRWLIYDSATGKASIPSAGPPPQHEEIEWPERTSLLHRIKEWIRR